MNSNHESYWATLDDIREFVAERIGFGGNSATRESRRLLTRTSSDYSRRNRDARTPFFRNVVDKTIGLISPRWQLSRLKSRAALDLHLRHYEAASTGRRTNGWNRSGADANASIGPALQPLREVARDLVRNNPWAESALSIIADHTVGYGITAKPFPANKQALDIWREWFETTACDADGRHDGYGLQKLIARTVAESGEVLVRRRVRFLDANGDPERGLPLPLQLQVLDPDFLDTTKDTTSTLPNGGRIIQGVEFDATGQRVAYWLYRDHPGAAYGASPQSSRIPAESVLHIFKSTRPGQVRAPSWFGPVVLRMKDLDEFEDATLVKQKIAACLAVLYQNADGANLPIGGDSSENGVGLDLLEPGMIRSIHAGENITVVDPPTARDYPDVTKTALRAIATGMGITYEDLTGDYSEMNFSASRAAHIKHWQRVDDWRWRMLIPQFCDPVWRWAMESAIIMRRVRGEAPTARWSPPPPPMIDPVNEGLAYQRNVRNGIQTLQEVHRERGYDSDELIAEMIETNKKLDQAGLILDCDPRLTTQAGQLQGKALPKSTAAPSAADDEEAEEAPARALRHALSLREVVNRR